MIATMLNVDVSLLDDPDYKESAVGSLGCTIRYLMQTLGTEWGRDMIHKDLWSTLLIKQLKQYKEEGVTHVFIEDCRFLSELECLLDSRTLNGEGCNIKPIFICDPQQPLPFKYHESEELAVHLLKHIRANPLDSSNCLKLLERNCKVVYNHKQPHLFATQEHSMRDALANFLSQ